MTDTAGTDTLARALYRAWLDGQRAALRLRPADGGLEEWYWRSHGPAERAGWLAVARGEGG